MSRQKKLVQSLHSSMFTLSVTNQITHLTIANRSRVTICLCHTV